MIASRFRGTTGKTTTPALWSGAATLLLCLGVLSPGALAQEPSPRPSAPRYRMTLPWAVDAALEHYPAVAAAQQSVEGARAGERGARSTWWPSVTVGGSLTRFQFPMLVRPLHALDANQIRFDHEPVQGSVFMDWLVFDGGGRTARIRRAEAVAQESDAGLAATTISVIEGTVAAFLQVRTLREVREAQRSQVEALDAELDRAALLLEAGRAPRVELLRAQAAVSQAEADLASLEAMLRTAEAQLGRLVGLERKAIAELPLAPVALSRSRSSGDLDPHVDSLHPTLRASWSRVLQASASESEARSRWIPDLGLSAGARQYGATSGNFANEWQVGLVLSYPVFTGFRRSSEVESARARLEFAREQHRLAQFRIQHDLDEAEAALQGADARVVALERAVEQFQEVARIEALALETGAGVQRDFLDAQADLFRSQAALAEARNATVLARTRRAAAQGALDRDWITETLESQP